MDETDRPVAPPPENVAAPLEKKHLKRVRDKRARDSAASDVQVGH